MCEGHSNTTNKGLISNDKYTYILRRQDFSFDVPHVFQGFSHVSFRL